MIVMFDVVAVLVGGLTLSASLGRSAPGWAVRITMGSTALALGLVGIAAIRVANAPEPLRVPGTDAWAVDGLTVLVSAFSLAMALLVQGFARRHLAMEPFGIRFFPRSLAVVAATVLLAMADSWWAVALAWVGVSVATPMLIAHDGRSASRAAASAARRTFVIGDAAIVAAAILAAALPSANRVWVALLVVVAAATRGALFPFHGWLRVSLHAPAPTSAFLHAGVVNGGGLLMVRTFPEVAGALVATWAGVLVGLVSAVIGIAVMRTRPDAKGALVWSTTAQMGCMTVQCALGLVGPAVVHLIGHGMFKGHLLLAAPSTVQALDDRLRRQPARRTEASPPAAAAALAFAVAAVVVVGASWARVPVLDHPAGWLPIVLLAGLAASTVRAAVTWTSGQASVAVAVAAVGSAGAAMAVAHLVEVIIGWAPASTGAPGAAGAAVVIISTLGAAAIVLHGWSRRHESPDGAPEPAVREPDELPIADLAWLQAHALSHGKPALVTRSPS